MRLLQVLPFLFAFLFSAGAMSAEQAVEIARRLVSENERRLVGDRPSDGYELHLPAAELARIVLEPVSETEPFQQSPCMLSPVGSGRAIELHRQCNVLECREIRNQVEGLEHETDRLAAKARELGLGQLTKTPTCHNRLAARRAIHCADDM